jgi:hypothetical protein
MSQVRFTWNPKKAKRNFRDHGVSFEEAEQVFSDQFYITLSDCDVEGEHGFTP